MNDLIASHKAVSEHFHHLKSFLELQRFKTSRLVYYMHVHMQTTCTNFVNGSCHHQAIFGNSSITDHIVYHYDD